MQLHDEPRRSDHAPQYVPRSLVRPPRAGTGADPRAALEKRRQEIVAVADLAGPTIQSHPWEKMLAGRKPEISPLARSVPKDFYLVEFRSLTKMLEAMDVSDLWGAHLFNQGIREARTQNVGDRLRQQLAVESTPLARPFTTRWWMRSRSPAATCFCARAAT